MPNIGILTLATLAAASSATLHAQEPRNPPELDRMVTTTVHPERRADSYITLVPTKPTILYSERAQEVEGNIEVIWGPRPESIVIPAQIMIHPLEVGVPVNMYLVQFKGMDVFYPIFISNVAE